MGKAQAAGSVSKADMISMMNSWRSNYWSNALVEDSSLDACAQWTAEEMAGINANNHLKYLGYSETSARCSGFGFGGGSTVFVTENWAKDYSMTLDLLASYWDDYDHMLPATSEQYCFVGVGIAEASNGSVYYVLQAGAIPDQGCSATSVTSQASSVDYTADSSNYVNPIITSTPNYDGAIYHEVLSGQTLYYIAVSYGVTIDEIKTLNALTSNNIYPGNVLKIKLEPTATVTPTRTVTVPLPTRTQSQATMTPTPQATSTITPTPTPTKVNIFKAIDRQWFGFGLLILSAAGFFVVFYFFFLKQLLKK